MKKLPIAAAFVVFSMILCAQTEVLGVGNFIHVVANLDKSIEFYRDAIGLDLTGAPGPHVFSANAAVSSLYDAPGAQSRVASLRIPGSEMAVEIVEFQGVNSTPVRPRLQDPGAITLNLFVRDLDPVMARLKRGNAEIVSSGSRQAMTKDPDGIFVKLTQRDAAPATAVPATSNVIGAGFGVTVVDLNKTLQFYREVLGFQQQSGTPDTGQALIAGVQSVQVRGSTLLVPGSAFPVEFLEFKGVDQKPAHAAIHDPGASVLRLRVRDLDAVVKALGAAGAPIASAGGEIVNLGRSRAVIMREPNNLFLQALQAAPAQ